MTHIYLHKAPGRARLEIRAGALVPRVIAVGPAFARVAIVAGGALLLGGDAVRVTITVGAGCTLELEDIGGTVAYNADGLGSEWVVDATIEADALLIWHGLPFVVADGAKVDRRTTITLSGAGAVACLRETIVLGRTGERGGTIDLRTTVNSIAADVPVGPAQNGSVAEPVFVERLTVRGAEPVPGVLGGHRVLDSLLLLGVRAPADAPEKSSGGSTEVLHLESPASIARSLQNDAHRSVLSPLWESWCAHALAVHADGVGAALAVGAVEPDPPSDGEYEAELLHSPPPPAPLRLIASQFGSRL